MEPLEDRLRNQARLLGFDRVGIVRAGPADGFPAFQNWLAEGHGGTMEHLYEFAEQRQHPESILTGVQSVVMLARSYNPSRAEPEREPHRGRVARYARGRDYHRVIWDAVNLLRTWLQNEVDGCRTRGVCDTAPLLERDFARRAGLGWFGKNTLLINRQLGSYLFLAALLTNLELRPDEPFTKDHCGSCTACLDACPTDAFVGPRVLDARKCISYLTIERRLPVPEEMRPGLGDWVFGCDVCQEVCPWNRKAPPATTTVFQDNEDLWGVDLLALMQMDEATFRGHFRRTPLMRAKRVGVLRSAAFVLGNQGDRSALPTLNGALLDPEEQIREAAAWAIARIHARHPEPGDTP